MKEGGKQGFGKHDGGDLERKGDGGDGGCGNGHGKKKAVVQEGAGRLQGGDGDVDGKYGRRRRKRAAAVAVAVAVEQKGGRKGCRFPPKSPGGRADITLEGRRPTVAVTPHCGRSGTKTAATPTALSTAIQGDRKSVV